MLAYQKQKQGICWKRETIFVSVTFFLKLNWSSLFSKIQGKECWELFILNMQLFSPCNMCTPETCCQACWLKEISLSQENKDFDKCFFWMLPNCSEPLECKYLTLWHKVECADHSPVHFFSVLFPTGHEKGELSLFIFLFIMKTSYILESERRHSKVSCTWKTAWHLVFM